MVTDVMGDVEAEEAAVGSDSNISFVSLAIISVLLPFPPASLGFRFDAEGFRAGEADTAL